MQNKIKELKDLGIAYKVALEFDYIPSPDEVNEVHEFLLDDHSKPHDVVAILNLLVILTKYEGNSTGDLEGKVFNIIETL
jgi:hypothetical protein